MIPGTLLIDDRMSGRAFRFRATLLLCSTLLVLLGVQRAVGREAGDPIRLEWVEGDMAGLTGISAADGAKTIGYVQYRQHRSGDVLEIVRIAHFTDGSSDEDRVKAHVGKDLRTIGGRTIIRNSKGVATVDLTIDVAGGHITGFSGLGSDRKNYDEHVELPPGTYWGPLISLVIKNFDHNAEDNRLVFNSVVATPKPRVIGMELLRGDKTTVDRRGGKIQVTQYELRPTINPVVDPIVHMMAPETHFFVQPGDPPAMARFEGPRNYAGQQIRIE